MATSDAAAREMLPAPRPQDVTLDFSTTPVFPAAVATHGNSVENYRADANLNTTVRGGDAFNRPSSTGDVPKPTTLAVSTRTNRDDRPFIVTPSGVDARSPRVRSARRTARHALLTATQVAGTQAAATASAASALHGLENHRIPSPPAPAPSPAPTYFARPRLSMSRTANALEEAFNPARSTGGRRTHGSSPSSGERKPELPGPMTLEDAVDLKHPDSEDERTAGGRETCAQASPFRLPGAWTSFPSPDRAAILQHWPAFRGAPRGSRRKTRRVTRPTSSGPSRLLLPLTVNSTSSWPSGLRPPPSPSVSPRSEPRDAGRTRSRRPSKKHQLPLAPSPTLPEPRRPPTAPPRLPPRSPRTPRAPPPTPRNAEKLCGLPGRTARRRPVVLPRQELS